MPFGADNRQFQGFSRTFAEVGEYFILPLDASQETLEAKARDMVDFTFRQLMMQAGRDTIADAGFRCNVCIIENGGSLLIYVLYNG